MRHLRTDDVDELAAAVASRNRRYLQMDAGRLQGEVLDLRLGGVQLFRERVNVGMRIEAAPPSELVSFAVVLQAPGVLRFCSGALQPGGFLQASGGEWEARFERGIDYVGCILARDRFERAALDLHGCPVDPTWFRSTPRCADLAATARLADLMQRALSGPELPQELQHGGVARQFEAELLDLAFAVLTSTKDRARVEPAWLRRRAVEQALEYVDGTPEPWPTIPDLCRAAGVSQRTLEYAFRELLGVTPVRYLKLLRLNRAHRALGGSSSHHETVTSVAFRFGFSDVGRFAREYRQLFGERPSETLRRR